MKTSRYILLAALTVIAASCQDKIAPEQTTNEVIFSASIDSPATKVVLGDAYVGSDNLTHYPMLWYGAEKITVFDANGNNKSFIGEAATAKASIDFRHNSATVFELEEGTEYYAVEPNHTGHTISGGEITVKFVANSQSPDSSNGNLPLASGENATVALAKTKDTYLSFKPVTALIKFTVGSENVTRVVFKGVDNPAIAGDNVVFDYTGDEPVLKSIGMPKNTMYLTNNKSFTVGATYYIAVLPTTLTPAIGFNFNGSTSNTKYKTGKESIKLEPGMILDLGLIEIAAPAAQ